MRSSAAVTAGAIGSSAAGRIFAQPGYLNILCCQSRPLKLAAAGAGAKEGNGSHCDVRSTAAPRERAARRALTGFSWSSERPRGCASLLPPSRSGSQRMLRTWGMQPILSRGPGAPPTGPSASRLRRSQSHATTDHCWAAGSPIPHCTRSSAAVTAGAKGARVARRVAWKHSAAGRILAQPGLWTSCAVSHGA